MTGRLITPTYPDSADGAIAMLKAESCYDIGEAKATPDQWVRGVWLVEFAGHSVVVYLAGYPNPWGELRDSNDFEEI